MSKKEMKCLIVLFLSWTLNSSRLPLLPSLLLICTLGLINRFKCRFWTWKVASLFCWSILPSWPSCGLTLISSFATPRPSEGAMLDVPPAKTQDGLSQGGCITQLQKWAAEVTLPECSKKRWLQQSLLALLACELHPRETWLCPKTSLDSKGDSMNLYPQRL